MPEGETIVQNIEIRINDDFPNQEGGTVVPVTVTITGTNDQPVITVADDGDETLVEAAATSNDEDTNVTATGTITFTDIDLDANDVANAPSPDTHSSEVEFVSASWIPAGGVAEDAVSIEEMEAPGELTTTDVTPSESTAGENSLAWNYDATDAEFDFLPEGAELTLVYDVVISDSSMAENASTTQTVTLKVTGSNDKPTIENATTSDTIVVELGADADETTPSNTAMGELNAEGNWDDLDAGETDTLMITRGAAGNAEEEEGLETLDLTFDPETGNAEIVGTYGTLSINALGSYTYTLNDAAQATQELDDGDEEADVFSYTISNGMGDGNEVTSTLTIDIQGTNDAPVANNDTGYVFGEDDAVDILNVRANDTDIDADDIPATMELDIIDAAVTVATIEGDATIFGEEDYSDLGFAIDENGELTFEPTGVWDALDAGDVATVTLTYEISDELGASSQATATITVNGSNDGPTIVEQSDVAALEEPDTLSTSGTITFDDLDADDTFTISVESVTTTGTDEQLNGANQALLDMFGVLDTAPTSDEGDIEWSFTGTPATFAYLGAEEAVTLTYTVRVTDSQMAFIETTVSLTIDGTNATPVINDEELTITVAEVTDAQDGSELETMTGSAQISFSDDDDIDYSAGDLTFSITSSSADGPDGTAGALEGVDLTSLLTLPTGSAETPFVRGQTATVSFAAAEDLFDYLDASESATLSYQITLTDGAGETATVDLNVTVNGANDPIVIDSDASTLSGTVNEFAEADESTISAPYMSTGAIVFSDADDGAAPTAGDPALGEGGDNYRGDISHEIVVTDGGFELRWTFTVSDEDIEDLGDGVSETQTYTFAITDDMGSTQEETVTITITGSDDAPEIAIGGPDSAPFLGGGVVEAGETPFLPFDPFETTKGSDALDGDGDGEKDQSAISGTVNVELGEGVFNWSDPDAGETAMLRITSAAHTMSFEGFDGGEDDSDPVFAPVTTETPTELQGTYGTLTIHSDGSYTYQLNDDLETTEGLDAGENATEVFAYVLSTGVEGSETTTGTLAIDILGANDAPVVANATSSADVSESPAVEGDPITASGTIAVSDVDDDDTVMIAVVSSVATDGITEGLTAETSELQDLVSLPGMELTGEELFNFPVPIGAVSFATSAGVSWNFSGMESTFDYLAEGEMLDLTYTVDIYDQWGASATHDVTITVTGTNDAPVFTVNDPIVDTEGDSLVVVAEPGDGDLVVDAPEDIVTIDLLNTTTEVPDGEGTVSVPIVQVEDLDASDVASVSNITVTSNTLSAVADAIGATQEEIEAAFTVVDGVGVTYDRNATIFDRLDDGEQIEVEVGFAVWSGNDSMSQTVDILINGANDEPYLVGEASDLTGTVSERDDLAENENDGVITFETVLQFDDIELGDAHFVAAIAVDNGEMSADDYLGNGLAGFGDLAIGPNAGEVIFTFTVPAADLDLLTAGQSVTQLYSIQIGDFTDTIERPFALTITGTNDAPVIEMESATIAETVVETVDADVAETFSTTGINTILFSDVDTDNDPAVGTPNADVLTTSSKLVSVTQKADGEQDVDLTEGWSGGSLGLDQFADESGPGVNWSWSGANGDFDFLRDGETLELVYAITVDDGTETDNATATQNVTVTVTGANDTPVAVADVVTQAVLEDATEALVIDVLGNDTDVDGEVSENVFNDFTTVSVVDEMEEAKSKAKGITAEGFDGATVEDLGFSFNEETGRVEFTPGDVFDILDAGDSVDVTIGYEMADAFGETSTSTMTVTVEGQNDAPEIDGKMAQAGTVSEVTELQGDDEPAALEASGDIFFNDLDGDDSHNSSVSYVEGVTSVEGLDGVPIDLSTLEGLMMLDEEGITNGNVGWDFAAAESLFDFLKAGDTATLTYRVSISDSGLASDSVDVTITVNGANDGPVIASASMDSATEAGGDGNDTGGSIVLEGSLNAEGGNWSDVDFGDTQGLQVVAAGQEAEVQPPLSFNEEGVATVISALGTLTLTASGDYTYTVNEEAEAVEALDDGTSTTDVFTYVIADGDVLQSTSTLTITINGTNDAPVISAEEGELEAIVNVAMSEEGVISADGTFTSSDVDAADMLFATVTNASVSDGRAPDAEVNLLAMLAISTEDSIGSSNILVDGAANWQFSASADDFDYLNEEETLEIDFEVSVTDGTATTTETVTVTITGANSAPGIAVTGEVTHVESVDDNVDGGALAYTAIGGSVTDTDTGSYEGAVLSAVVDGGTADDALTVLATEGLVVNGANIEDNEGTVLATVGGDTTSSLTITLAAGTTAATASLILAQVAYATRADDLADGTEKTVTFSLDDGSDDNSASNEASSTVTIQVSNDSPVAGDDTISVDEGGFAFTNVFANDSDPEGDTLSVDVFEDEKDGGSTKPSPEGLMITTDRGATFSYFGNGNGIYDASGSAEIEALGANESITDTFSYIVTDGNGGTGSATVTVTINGENDAIVAVDDAIVAVEGDGETLSGNLLANDTDVDANDTKAVTSVSGGAGLSSQATAGGFELTHESGVTIFVAADGSYTVNNADAANTTPINASFTYVAEDSEGAVDSATVSVSITGENDAAQIAGDTSGDATEFVTDATTGTLTISDVDSEEAFVAEVLTSDLGALTINADGTWSYVLNQEAPELADLDFGDTLLDSFTVTSVDLTMATIDITVNGGNLGPIAQNDTFAISQVASGLNGDVLADNGFGADVDQDAGALNVTAVNGGANVGTQFTLPSGALLTMLADGTFDYDPNGIFDDLPLGAGASDSFTYEVSDGVETDTATVTITTIGSSQTVDDEDNTVVGSGSGENIDAGGGNDQVFGGGGDDSVSGGGGDDAVNGDEGNDTLEGGTGSDFLSAGEGNDLLVAVDGGDGVWGESRFFVAQTLEASNGALDGSSLTGYLQHNDVFDGGTGVDTLKGTEGDDAFLAFDAAYTDIIEGTDPNTARIQNIEVFNLGGGNDVLDLASSNANGDTYDVAVDVDGGAGSDWIFGGTADDTIDGGDGLDYITGSGGNNVLTGGGGAGQVDVFLFGDLEGLHSNVVTDFENGVDFLRVTGFGVGNVTDTGYSIANNEDGNAVITLTQDGTTTIELEGVDASLIGIEDFFFSA
ncbi:VCBS domain-containing protein [Roseobacteraceae bacterium S113]